MKTARAVDRFLHSRRLLPVSPKTVHYHEWALGKILALYPNVPRKPEVLQALIAFNDLSDSSRHGLWRSFRVFYLWLSRNTAVPNVMEYVPPPKVRRKFPRTLEPGEITRLLTYPHSQRDLALVALPLDTGARVGEIANLRWPDVKAGLLRVDGKSGERPIPLSPRVQQLLVGLGDTEHIWLGRYGPLTLHGVKLATRRALAKVGVYAPKAGPHMLRHTFGRHYIRRGGDVFSLQRIMGHQRLSTTMIYVAMNTNDLQEQHAKFSPLREHSFSR